MIFCYFNINGMVKAKLPKIFKVKKDKENPDQFIVRFKNFDKQQIKDLRKELDDFCKAYFERKAEY